MEPSKTELKKKYLAEQLEAARRAVNALTLSHESLQAKYPFPHSLSNELDEKLESLTSRFARLTDILTQKVFRAIDALELENEGTLLDRLNRMEKRGVISSASLWRDIRDLRNQISHDYLEDEIESLRNGAFKYCPDLFAAFKSAESYAQKIMERDE